jgi:hypothetical protein
MKHRPDLAKLVSRWNEPGQGNRLLLALLRGERTKDLLRRMLDDDSFSRRLACAPCPRRLPNNPWP